MIEAERDELLIRIDERVDQMRLAIFGSDAGKGLVADMAEMRPKVRGMMWAAGAIALTLLGRLSANLVFHI